MVCAAGLNGVQWCSILDRIQLLKALQIELHEVKIIFEKTPFLTNTTSAPLTHHQHFFVWITDTQKEITVNFYLIICCLKAEGIIKERETFLTFLQPLKINHFVLIYAIICMNLEDMLSLLTGLSASVIALLLLVLPTTPRMIF